MTVASFSSNWNSCSLYWCCTSTKTCRKYESNVCI